VHRRHESAAMRPVRLDAPRRPGRRRQGRVQSPVRCRRLAGGGRQARSGHREVLPRGGDRRALRGAALPHGALLPVERPRRGGARALPPRPRHGRPALPRRFAGQRGRPPDRRCPGSPRRAPGRLRQAPPGRSRHAARHTRPGAVLRTRAPEVRGQLRAGGGGVPAGGPAAADIRHGRGARAAGAAGHRPLRRAGRLDGLDPTSARRWPNRESSTRQSNCIASRLGSGRTPPARARTWPRP
jgi:hypothetical protein